MTILRGWKKVTVITRWLYYQGGHEADLDLWLFTVPYFSIRPSRSSTTHHACVAILVSYVLMGWTSGFIAVDGGRRSTPWVHLTVIPRLDSVHMKPRLSPVMQSTRSQRSHKKIGCCVNSLYPRAGFIVSCHQYGTYEIPVVSQMSLHGESSGDVVKCWLFSQATSMHWCIQENFRHINYNINSFIIKWTLPFLTPHYHEHPYNSDGSCIVNPH